MVGPESNSGLAHSRYSRNFKDQFPDQSDVLERKKEIGVLLLLSSQFGREGVTKKNQLTWMLNGSKSIPKCDHVKGGG